MLLRCDLPSRVLCNGRVDCRVLMVRLSGCGLSCTDGEDYQVVDCRVLVVRTVRLWIVVYWW